MRKIVVACILFFALVTLSSMSIAQEQLPELPVVLRLEAEIAIRDLDWNFDGTLLAFADANEGVTVIHVETGEIDLPLNRPEGGILTGQSIAWSSKQNQLLIVNNLSRLWNYAQNTLLDNFEFPIAEDYEPVGNADWSPTEDRFAILVRECEARTPVRPGARVEIWDVATSISLQIAGCVSKGFGVVRWNPQGTQLAITGFSIFDQEGFVESEEIEIWDVANRERILTIHELKDPWGLAWSPSGDMIAFTTFIGTNQFIQVRDVTDGEIVSESQVVLGVYPPIDWHPSENLIATGGQDGSVRIWDALTGLQLYELPVYEDTVNDVSWSPDGSMLASVGDDGRLFIWDTSTLQGHIDTRHQQQAV